MLRQRRAPAARVRWHVDLGYDAYAAPEYRGDFDGFGGEVVYDEPMVAEASGSTRALDAAAEAAPTAVELQVVEEKSAPAAKPASV